jgi:hypothetical protein
MHQPVTSQADHVVAACMYCMGSKVSGLSRIYLYSSYFAFGCISKFRESTAFSNLMEYKKMPRHCQPPKDNKKIILLFEKK